MKRELTCIVCPIGCSLEVELDNGKVVSVTGNTCPRGKVYAENECTNPKRTITTTVKCSNGEVLPVKTKEPIAKEKIFEAMKVINTTVATTPIEVGDVIIDDVFGSELVATRNMK
ncbi:MAG: DUF1667 domain-containing protein [Ruminococcaceae bacterium]|nr:DUF1667 domain-containing protein [Oscillospiraceae bacterium]